MVAVQAEGCAPIVRAFTAGEEFASRWENAVTVAAGLRVPQAIGDFLILRALRESRGTAVAVSERELVEGARELAPPRGNPCLSGGSATLAALKELLFQGWVSPKERVVLFSIGSGLKYPET